VWFAIGNKAITVVVGGARAGSTIRAFLNVQIFHVLRTGLNQVVTVATRDGVGALNTAVSTVRNTSTPSDQCFSGFSG